MILQKMIGKIKNFTFTKLFLLISISLGVTSIAFKDYTFLFIYIIFFFTSFLLTKFGFKRIKQLNILQNIRSDGPELHLSKQNTPTMGGIFIISPFLFLLIILNNGFELKNLFILFLCTLGFFILGIFDDYLSINKKESTGLKTTEKFYLQSIISTFFIVFAFKENYINTVIAIPNGWTINNNLIIFLISLITLVGFSNAVNLTDGLDGLASGCSSIIFYGLGTEILFKNQKELIIYSLLCFAMSGLCMGFLKFNKYPAKIFMGDTGSLTIGSILGSIAIMTNSYFSLIIMAGTFIIEALSVILQVGFFKLTKKLFQNGKRIFLMAPLHHHFELKGIKEEVIVENFWKINVFLVILAILINLNL